MRGAGAHTQTGIALAMTEFMTVSVLLTAIGVVAASGLLVFLHALVTAPLGYQDEMGFHFGLPASELVE